MNKGLAIAVGAGSLVLGSTALAQTNSTPLALSNTSLSPSLQGAAPPQQPSFFNLRVGGLIPFDSGLRDQSTTLVGVGVDYTFSNQWVPNGESFVSVDWLARTKGGGRFNVFPFCINERFYLTPKGAGANSMMGAAGQAYAFLGVGGFLFDFNSSTFRFGGRAGLGVMLTNNILAEAAVYLSTAVEGVRANAVGAYIGYKFGG